MNKIIFSLICLFTSITFGKLGNEGGGGGHPCKEDFLNTLLWVASAGTNHMEHLTDDDVRILAKAFEIPDPRRNPGFTVAISEEPIKGCPNTDNPYACSYPRKNKLELYCDPTNEKGWTSLNFERKIKYAIHELLWWASDTYRDDNFFYSTGIATRLVNAAAPKKSTNPSDEICLQNMKNLRTSMQSYGNITKQENHSTIERQNAVAEIKKHADLCLVTCSNELHSTCEDIKTLL